MKNAGKCKTNPTNPKMQEVVWAEIEGAQGAPKAPLGPSEGAQTNFHQEFVLLDFGKSRFKLEAHRPWVFKPWMVLLIG